jgi:hypothetical protein
MFRLVVSWNCGCNYETVKEASSVEELLPEAEKYDKEGLRWAIETNSGEVQEVSSIHKNIFPFVASIFESN